jgi:hypothetical protein
MSEFGLAAEILGEEVERAQHRIRRETAQRAERSIFHRVAEIAQERDVL